MGVIFYLYNSLNTAQTDATWRLQCRLYCIVHGQPNKTQTAKFSLSKLIHSLFPQNYFIFLAFQLHDRKCKGISSEKQGTQKPKEYIAQPTDDVRRIFVKSQTLFVKTRHQISYLLTTDDQRTPSHCLDNYLLKHKLDKFARHSGISFQSIISVCLQITKHLSVRTCYLHI